MTSPVIGPEPRPDSPNVHWPLPTTITTTAATTTTTLPLPPQPQQGLYVRLRQKTTKEQDVSYRNWNAFVGDGVEKRLPVTTAENRMKVCVPMIPPELEESTQGQSTNQDGYELESRHPRSSGSHFTAPMPHLITSKIAQAKDKPQVHYIMHMDIKLKNQRLRATNRRSMKLNADIHNAFSVTSLWEIVRIYQKNLNGRVSCERWSGGGGEWRGDGGGFCGGGEWRGVVVMVLLNRRRWW
ncbi:hypothetical protein Tco_0714219 [Tanacetum coccineum]